MGAGEKGEEIPTKSNDEHRTKSETDVGEHLVIGEKQEIQNLGTIDSPETVTLSVSASSGIVVGGGGGVCGGGGGGSGEMGGVVIEVEEIEVEGEDDQEED